MNTLLSTIRFSACTFAALAGLTLILTAQEKINATQRISGKIQSVDLTNKTISIKNYPTGHTLTLNLGKNFDITIREQIDYDELPKLQWLRIYGVRDDKNKTIHNGDAFIGNYSNISPLIQKGITYGQIDWDEGDFKDKLQWINGGIYRSFDTGIYSRDGHKKYKLKVGNDYYALTSKRTIRPSVFEDKFAQPTAKIQPEKWVDVKYEAANAKRVATSIYLYNDKSYSPPYWANYPIGASGQTVSSLTKKIEAVKNAYIENKADIKSAMPVSMKIVPELANLNEPIALWFEVISFVKPNSIITFYGDYLKKGLGDQRAIPVNWNDSGVDLETKKRKFTANVKLPSHELGQHLIKWSCDIGGDISEYSRSYAIIDDNTAVITFNNLSVPSMRTEFENKYLPYNTWQQDLLQSINWPDERLKVASNWSRISKESRQTGVSPGFMLLYTGWGASQLREESSVFQRVLLSGMKEVIPFFGFNSDDVNFGDYGMGKETVEIARDLGYKYVHSLCTNSHIDGSFGINQSGKPERPYFMSREDYRKPQRDKVHPIMGFSQLQWNNPLAIKYFSHYCIGAGEFTTLDVGSVQKNDDWETYYSRIDNFLDALYQNSKSQNAPYFIQLNYQFESKHPSSVVASCKRQLNFLLDKAKIEKVVFTTNNGIADYYLNHYKGHPETTTYFQDYYSGFSVGGKPLDYPDVMQIENHQQMVVSNRGALLPDKFYDYEATWNYADCGDLNIPRSRSKWGTIPDEDGKYKFDISPKIVDTRKFSATETRRNEDTEITVIVLAESEQKNLPISIWDIQREFSKLQSNYTVSGEGNARFVPVRAPFTGNLNGYLIADVVKGTNKFKITINSPQRKSERVEFEIKNSFKGKVFETNGRKDAYLWAKYPWDTTVKINVPVNKTLNIYISPRSEKQTLNAGANVLTIPYGERLQITGYSKAELVDMLNSETL